MPGPATAATLGAVRRAWAEGSSVATVSYRTGAASLVVPVAGPLAGWRLEQVRRHFGEPARVVIGVQPGVPFTDPRPWARWVTAAGLALAMRRFSEATVVMGEDPGLDRWAVALLAWGASSFSTPDDGLAHLLVDEYGVARGAVRAEPVAPFPAVTGSGADGVPNGGLYGPGARAGLTYVELPSTSVVQRVRARLQRALPEVTGRLRPLR